MHDEPSELDLVYEDLRKAQATIEILRTQNKQLRKTLREVQQAVSTLTAWVPHSETGA